MTTALLTVDDLKNKIKNQAIAKAAEPDTGFIKVPKVTATRGRFMLPDGQNLDQFNAVVLAVKYSNQYYDTPYNAKDIKPPVCFAESWDADEAYPHERSTEPQATACANCPQNKFQNLGKDNGKTRWGAKPCNNRLRLAVVTAESAKNNEIWELQVPKASITNWNEYFKYIGRCEANLFDVLTCIELDPKETYDKLCFSKAQDIKLSKVDDLLEQVLKLFS